MLGKARRVCAREGMEGRHGGCVLGKARRVCSREGTEGVC